MFQSSKRCESYFEHVNEEKKKSQTSKQRRRLSLLEKVSRSDKQLQNYIERKYLSPMNDRKKHLRPVNEDKM